MSLLVVSAGAGERERWLDRPGCPRSAFWPGRQPTFPTRDALGAHLATCARASSSQASTTPGGADFSVLPRPSESEFGSSDLRG